MKNWDFLPEPMAVTEQRWSPDAEPLLCTSTLVYQHEDYVRECLEGILMQKTTFPIRVLIHDDFSRDKTLEIVRSYEQRYPDLIRVFTQPSNTYSLPAEEKRKTRVPYRQAHVGKYIALCEGDDYWTDPLKLQKQVEFLESHSTYALCYHGFQKRTGTNAVSPKLWPKRGHDFSADELVASPTGIATATKVFRNVLMEFEGTKKQYQGGDYFLNAYLSMFGHAKFLDSVKPSVRRLHPGGVWTSRGAELQSFGVVNIKYKNYKFFEACGDVPRATLALRALRDALDQQLPKLDPRHGEARFSLHRMSLEFRGVRLSLSYWPVLLWLKKCLVFLKLRSK
jgi:glycosyltransferase involved in cell wall biosynthesis